MKSSFELEQSAKILSCYNNDISKGGKRAQIGEVRTWGGKRFVRMQSGWMKYDHGNKKIDSHKKTSSHTGESEKEFSHDQVIKDHISSMSDAERKEQISKMNKKLDHFRNIQKKLSDHNLSSGQATIINNSHLDKNKQIQQLQNKIAEVKHGHLSEEELLAERDKLQKEVEKLVKDNPLKNAEKITDLKAEIKGINHTGYRKFDSTSKDVVLNGHKKNFIDDKALINDSTPWDEDLWDSEIDEEENDKIDKTLNHQKINKLNKEFFGQKTYLANNSIAFKQNVPDEAKIKVTFDNGMSAERTFKQLKDFVEKTAQENPEPKLKRVPSEPMKPIMTGDKGSPEYKAKWRKYFQEKEEVEKIKKENEALSDDHIKKNILPIKDIQILSLK